MNNIKDKLIALEGNVKFNIGRLAYGVFLALFGVVNISMTHTTVGVVCAAISFYKLSK